MPRRTPTKPARPKAVHPMWKPQPQNPWPARAGYALAFLALAALVVLLVMNLENKTTAEQDTPEWQQARALLYPQHGYTVYETAKDVPWETVMNPDLPWTADEVETVNDAATLIATVMGDDDPAVRALPQPEIGDQRAVKQIRPIDTPIAVRQPRMEFIDSMWSPRDGVVFITRRVVASSVILTASQLYAKGRTASLVPDQATALAGNPDAVKEKVLDECDRFHAKLEDYITHQKPKDWERMLLQIRVIRHNVSTHQRTGPMFQRVDR